MCHAGRVSTLSAVHGVAPAVTVAAALDRAQLRGRRVIVRYRERQGDGSYRLFDMRDLRATSDVETDADGQPWVRIIQEARWYAYLALPDEQRPESCPRSKAVRAEAVWVEE